jgi:hypothetical protein
VLGLCFAVKINGLSADNFYFSGSGRELNSLYKHVITTKEHLMDFLTYSIWLKMDATMLKENAMESSD